MNKTELISNVAKCAGVTLHDAKNIINCYHEAIIKTLDMGGKVTLTGFGTFKTIRRKVRTGINPKTKETIKIPAKNVPVFKAGKTLKDRVSD